MAQTSEYNARLFGARWRRALHEVRYHWLTDRMQLLGLREPSMIELGCSDAKTVGFLDDAGLSPRRYLGLDAGWGGGIEAGRTRWADRDEVRLEVCTHPDEMPTPAEPFDVAVCQETLEHVPDDLVEPYLDALAARTDGWLLVTVPIERGLNFVLKYGVKTALRLHRPPYTPAEFLNAAASRMERVPHRDHKGFDDRKLVDQIGARFELVEVKGFLPGLPMRTANYHLGIVARTR